MKQRQQQLQFRSGTQLTRSILHTTQTGTESITNLGGKIIGSGNFEDKGINHPSDS